VRVVRVVGLVWGCEGCGGCRGCEGCGAKVPFCLDQFDQRRFLAFPVGGECVFAVSQVKIFQG